MSAIFFVAALYFSCRKAPNGWRREAHAGVTGRAINREKKNAFWPKQKKGQSSVLLKLLIDPCPELHLALTSLRASRCESRAVARALFSAVLLAARSWKSPCVDTETKGVSRRGRAAAVSGDVGMIAPSTQHCCRKRYRRLFPERILFRRRKTYTIHPSKPPAP